MSRVRLDQALVGRDLTRSRSQAESYIKLGAVEVDGRVVTKPGFLTNETAKIELTAQEQYVSRAALKLASVAQTLKLDFHDRVVLDVGSSTGGFTDYALRHGAKQVIAVELGTQQLHPTLRGNPKIELHEQTDIRNVRGLTMAPDIVVIDVSFVSLQEILPAVARLSTPRTHIIAMVKPQFEAASAGLKHKGVIKNDRARRDVLKDFERWVQGSFKLLDKADSEVKGAKGNRERFYLLQKT